MKNINLRKVVIKHVILGSTHLQYFICHCIFSISTLDVDICLCDPLDQDVSTVVHFDLATLSKVILRRSMMWTQNCSYGIEETNATNRPFFCIFPPTLYLFHTLEFFSLDTNLISIFKTGPKKNHSIAQVTLLFTLPPVFSPF